MCRGELPAAIAWLMSKCLSCWKWQWGVKEMPSPFPCSPVIRECSWKKTQREKKRSKNQLKGFHAIQAPIERSCQIGFNIKHTSYGEGTISVITLNLGSANLYWQNLHFRNKFCRTYRHLPGFYFLFFSRIESLILGGTEFDFFGPRNGSV